MTEVVTEMPRCCSIFIQSERARRRSPLALTSPARWIAPPISSSFSVSVVLPASGCEMMAKVRRWPAACATGDDMRSLKGGLRARARQKGNGEGTAAPQAGPAAAPLGDGRPHLRPRAELDPPDGQTVLIAGQGGG